MYAPPAPCGEPGARVRPVTVGATVSRRLPSTAGPPPSVAWSPRLGEAAFPAASAIVPPPGASAETPIPSASASLARTA